jgi:hypothetical protein
MSPRNRQILGSGANIRFGCIVGQKNMSRSERSAFRWSSSEKVLGLESVKDAEGNVIQEAPLPLWANFRQRALDIAVLEITKKTDLKISIKSLEIKTSTGRGFDFPQSPCGVCE